MAKKRKTKVTITSSFTIKDLAEQIYQLDHDEIICLFKEIDDLAKDYHTIDNDWNVLFQQWIDKRSEKSSNDPITTKDLRAIEDQYLAAFNLKRIGPCERTEHESSVQDRG